MKTSEVRVRKVATILFMAMVLLTAVMVFVVGMSVSPAFGMRMYDPTSSKAMVVHHDLYRGTPAQAKAEAKYLTKRYGWSSGSQWQCLVRLWEKESGWHWNSDNGDNGLTWGVPQSYPGSKMRSAGPNWRTNVTTQIRWGLRYIKSTYGSPCSAWSRWQDRAGSGSYGWY